MIYVGPVYISHRNYCHGNIDNASAKGRIANIVIWYASFFEDPSGVIKHLEMTKC